MTVAQQHRYEVWASNLFLVAFASGIVSQYWLGYGYFAPYHTPKSYLILYVANPLLLFTYYCVRRGVRWAKLLALALFAYVLLQLLSGSLSLACYDTPLEQAQLIGKYALEGTSFLLLLLSLRAPVETPLTT